MSDDAVPPKRVISSSNPPTRDVNAVVRVDLAIKLRSTKMKYEDIAKQCGFPSAQSCRKAVMRELNRVVVRDVEVLRTEEMDSLEQLELECWRIFSNKENVKQRLFAVDRILAIKERRARLMNLDVKPEEELANQNYTKKIILTHSSGGDNASPNS
jgi:hypothetical protein